MVGNPSSLRPLLVVLLAAAPAVAMPPPPSPPTPAMAGEAAGTPPLSPEDTRKVLKWIARQVNFEKEPYCYKRSYGRGAGEPLTTCSGNQQKSGLLCYSDCKPGYHGVGPVCWEECPSGYHDTGATCFREAHIVEKGRYGRGAGKPKKLHKFKLECGGGEESDAGLCYKPCRNGFHGVGPVCWQRSCPDGYHDDGATCRIDAESRARASYTRGAGEAMGCKQGMEKSGALCYPECKAGYRGNGPVCYERCPSSRPYDCGAGCAVSKTECIEDTAAMAYEPLMMVVDIALLVTTAGAGDEALSGAATAAKDAVAASVKTGATDAERAAARQAFKASMKTLARGFEKATSKRIAEQLKKYGSPNARVG